MAIDKKFVQVMGKRIAYVETGEGDPILFLHGNPTSSYLWRNVIPHLAGHGRCIAPDLVGQGDSDKLDDVGPGSYRFVEHRRYFDGFMAELDLEDSPGNVTLVVHDWGSALGFDWAHRHPEAVRAIAYMEAIVKPVDWDDWPEDAREIFQAMRSAVGEELVIDKNLFVDAILPSAIMRDLTDDEHDEYRRPFLEPEHRRPTLTWPREIPIDGEPADVHEIVAAYADWLSTSAIPKLFVNAEPGSILTGPQREFCRSWPNQTEVTVPGTHFIQEDSPDEIGQAIAGWLDGI